MVLQTPPTPGTPELSTTALYCYGVVSADAAASQAGTGLGGASVEPVRFRELAALTSPVPPGKVRAKRADLLRHFDVLGTAFEHGTVVPLRFGIVFDDEAALVRDFLEPRRDELLGLLRKLRDRQAGEHGERGARTDAADLDELAEGTTLGFGAEAEQEMRVLAHDQVRE